MVHPQIREEVPHEHVGEAIGAAEVGQDGDRDGNTNVAQEDELRVLGLVQWAPRAEVVDATEVAVLLALAASLLLALVVVMASDVGKQVHGPSEGLLADRVKEGGDGRLLGQLVELMDHPAHTACELLAGLGNEHHVALHVSSGLVVLAVGDLPGEVGNEESGVADPASGIIEDLGGREGLVAALVCEHPQSCAEESLDHSVQGPEDRAGGHRGDVLGSDELVEQGEGNTKTDDIAGHVGQTA